MSTISTDSTDADAIRQEVAQLASRVEAVERRLEFNGSSAPAAFDLAHVMAEVREITQELFPGTCEFTSEFDFESPDDRYVVVNVEATGSPQEIADRSCLWGERIRQVSEHAFRNLRLSIVPR